MCIHDEVSHISPHGLSLPLTAPPPLTASHCSTPSPCRPPSHCSTPPSFPGIRWECISGQQAWADLDHPMQVRVKRGNEASCCLMGPPHAGKGRFGFENT